MQKRMSAFASHRLVVSIARALLLIGALYSTPSWAGGTESGLISGGWNVYFDGYVFFYVDGTHQNPPCSAIPERWALNATSAVGKAQFTAFLLAFSAGKQVTINGTGDCVHGNTEELWEIFVY